MARISQSLVILASAVCVDYLCGFAATGFILDRAANPVRPPPCCGCYGRKMAAEDNEKIELGWKFHPGKIHGDMAEPPEVSSRHADKEDYAFLCYVVDRLTSRFPAYFLRYVRS